jgi:hypothetical protein
MLRNLTDGAGDQLRVHPPAGENGQQNIQLAEPDQRFAADNREVKGTVTVDERQNAVDQLLPPEIAHVA